MCSVLIGRREDRNRPYSMPTIDLTVKKSSRHHAKFDSDPIPGSLFGRQENAPFAPPTCLLPEYGAEDSPSITRAAGDGSRGSLLSLRLGKCVALSDHPSPCAEDAKKCFQPDSPVSGVFLPAAALASSSSCSSHLPRATPCKAPSSPSPISGSQPVHGRSPRQPPPTDRCCNGHSQCHHSGPSWPTEDIGTALESPRAQLHFPASLEREFGTVRTLFQNPISCPAKLQAWPLEGIHTWRPGWDE
jgi:hypothetical protein